MSIFSKTTSLGAKIVTLAVIFTLCASSLPATTFAQATSTPPTPEVPGCTDAAATNYNPAATEDDGSCEYPAEEETESATSTEETTEETATSTEETTEETATSTDETATSTNDGTDGTDVDSATSTATTTDDGTDGNATTTDDGTGEEGGSGDGGEGGDGVEDEDEGEPIPLISETELGDDSTPEDGEGISGELIRTGRNVTVVTGNAVAQSDVDTDVNSNLVRSEVNAPAGSDLDTYTLNATGTNEASVTNDAAAFAQTGDNEILATGVAEIFTGNAVSAVNIANVINSNVINSDGFLYLKNQILEEGQSLDLGSFFFPDSGEVHGLTGDCSLLSCRAEDIEYNFSQMNTATVTNDVIVEAITGENVIQGDIVDIYTGEARGGANVINVVNTNIIDSHYRLLTYNALGDLDGDLILPTEELFHAFFSRPNGMTQVEPEGIDILVDNDNTADVNNNLDTEAETGENDATTALDATIVTGRAESESNILNKINQNIYGGDSMFLQIRVHGNWSGDVYGLPDGLTWAWTPDGIIIYNEDSEIAPSELLPYDVDSYEAHFTDQNNVTIDNNITIDAISGKNEVNLSTLSADIETGNAVASANVMNIANTNVIGTNWTYAVINIFGDFDGNVAFSATDLAVDGSVSSSDDPLTPGSPLSYSYTVTNNSDKTATGVTLRQTLQNALIGGSNNQLEIPIGTLTPGASQTVNSTAFVADDFTAGTHEIIATAVVDSEESDGNTEDNASVLTLQIDIAEDTGGGASGSGSGTTTDDGTGTTADDGTGTTTDDGTGTTTDNGTGDDNSDGGSSISSGSSSGSSSGGGGGGGGKSKTKKVERKEVEADPNAPPFLIVEKFADEDDGDTIKAGEDVDYTIIITNKGGQAYDATVYDTLVNPIGSVMNEDSWELGTILAGEVIELTYTTTYDFKTPSGEYVNTATIEAYRFPETKENGEDPLNVDAAVHTIDIEGVPLAVGNVGVLAVYPAGDGTISALVSWETSKAALSQIFYGQKHPWSNFAEHLFNYGYPMKSFKFSRPKERHAMIIKGLKPGTQYSYRIDAATDEYDAVSREYTFTTPASVLSLALGAGDTFLPIATLLSRVAGVSTSAAPNTAPAATYTPPPPPAPIPDPEPEPVAAAPASGGSGLMGAVKDTFFGWFR